MKEVISCSPTLYSVLSTSACYCCSAALLYPQQSQSDWTFGQVLILRLTKYTNPLNSDPEENVISSIAFKLAKIGVENIQAAASHF